MEINGLSLEQFRQCADATGLWYYSENVIVHSDGHDRPSSKDGTPRCTARLAVRDSRGPGSRTSWKGRHGPYACWHAYRDVLSEVFRRYPDAVIRSGTSWRVTYRGREGFLATYPDTAYRNVGSEVSPVTMPELCECEGIPREAERFAVRSRPPARNWPPPPRLSPAVVRASRAYAASAELLGEGDKPADPVVFGPPDGETVTQVITN